MPIKVSVVVPVYNPGPYVTDCIDSLLRQSLPDDEYEAIFVDDGSTDETPARLDRLAADHPHMRVVHQENSGWPGKPRNVGIAAARGEYVMFVDHDDWLGDEALERMYEYGVANEADVVIGKMIGRGRNVPVELFRRNRPRASVADAPLIDSLTPHKMLRKEFLDRTGLRFPEGRRRLEDHVFVAEAYLRADSVAVLSDYPCYHHVKREDTANAGFRPIEPVGYFGNLREALDVVERYTEPGPLRDRLFRRWLRVEMVERLRGRRLLRLDSAQRKALFGEIHQVVVERFGPGVRAGLQPTQQIVAALVVADRLADVEAFARWEAGVKAAVSLEGLEWRDGRLRVGFAAEYRSDGMPLTFQLADGQERLNPPLSTAAWAAIDALGVDTSARLASSKLDLMLRERSGGADSFQPVQSERVRQPTGEPDLVRVILRGVATVDPATAATGSALRDGLWDAVVRVDLSGWNKTVRLGAERGESATERLGWLGADRLVLPCWTETADGLSLDVNQTTGRLRHDLAEAPAERFAATGERLTGVLPLLVSDETKVAVRLCDPACDRVLELTGILDPSDGGAALRAALPLSELGDTARRPEIDLTPAGCAAAPTAHSGFLRLPFLLRRTADGAVTVLAIPDAAAELAALAPAPATSPRTPLRVRLRRLAARTRRALLSR